MYNGQTVSVVLPTFNEEKSIKDVIDSFMAIRYVDEIIVIDNNASLRTRLEVMKTNARLIREPRQGYGHALTWNGRSKRRYNRHMRTRRHI